MTGAAGIPPGDRGNRDPSFLVWLIAAISLVLPWIGIGVAVWGVGQVLRGEALGWLLLAAGIGLIVLDIVIDFRFASPVVWASDEPDLNRRGRELIGRTATVTDAIAGGRGKVHAGDTLWMVEGPALPAGALVRIVDVKGTVLVVEAA